MKYILAFIFFFTGSAGYAQDGVLPLDKDKNVYYSDVAKPDLPKDSIFKKAQEWVVRAFGNYENVVTLEAADAGRIVLTSYAQVLTSKFEYVRYDMTIDCADKLLNIRISNLDGVSTTHSPEKLGVKDNDLITAREQALKIESGRRKKSDIEDEIKALKADNESVNNAMYKLLADLKLYVSEGETH
ncbi:DUF4468 domain-containing protein [Dyadobacter sandarakinus]|uniref:DUF4468 domain-containing protein n=1 Tax=Dyadobacter sandarakinus TaxID=2747268 RepID=A0ABX7I0H6_9BACT|nr:DUF4468 domain-containing protein [Dyadobacter sandarakinus]QRQ99521.1 DUF4468 domain-containing protein [Dyadobacter sandarakinus]